MEEGRLKASAAAPDRTPAAGAGGIRPDSRNPERIRASVTLDGRTYTKTFGRHERRKAEQWIRDTQREAAEGIAPPADRRTKLADYLLRWIDTMRPTLEPKTVDGYESTIRLHQLWHGVPSLW